MPEKYCCDALAVIHETMGTQPGVGAINKQAMREFDADCLMLAHTPGPDEIKAMRLRGHISRPAALAERFQKSGIRLRARRPITGQLGLAPVDVDPEEETDGDCLIAAR